MYEAVCDALLTIVAVVDVLEEGKINDGVDVDVVALRVADWMVPVATMFFAVIGSGNPVVTFPLLSTKSGTLVLGKAEGRTSE